mmetsp:Transcript_13609/g.26149  ORF Transcript_13609/g.26149 Transcript_13609/m.26149 type:complete len:223 (-) Transcript_13609:60-728(-)
MLLSVPKAIMLTGSNREVSGCTAEIRLIEVLVNGSHESGLWDSTNDSVHLLTALEDHARWDGADTILSSHTWRLICVQLYRFNLAIILSCKLVDQRSNHAAWPTPGRPEVNQYRYWRFQHLFLKRVIVHGGRCSPCLSGNTNSSCLGSNRHNSRGTLDAKTTENSTRTQRCWESRGARARYTRAAATRLRDANHSHTRTTRHHCRHITNRDLDKGNRGGEAV